MRRTLRAVLTLQAVLTLALLAAAPAAFGAEARLLTAADISGMGGTDFDGGVGDYLLRNDVLEAVILAVDVTPDFGIPIVAEALPGRGVIVDLGTRGDKNDQLSEIDHLVNLDANVIFYTQLDGFTNGATASVTVSGVVLLDPFSNILATSTYSVTDGNSWVDIETTVTNWNPFPVPVFSIGDADITGGRGRLPFQPFPARGHKPPPLDLSNVIAALGVWNYVTLAGNNRPSDGPTNPDGSPSGEVSYTFVADSITSPLVGVGSSDVTLAGNLVPGALAPDGGSLTFRRKLVVAKGNSVEASLDIALPELFVPAFGADFRTSYSGRVVDGAGVPVPDAHIFFDNTSPGADPLLVDGFVTLLDENQDGDIDGVIPASGGAPLPTTHVVSDGNGLFSVKLQALPFDGGLPFPQQYQARVEAPGRATQNIGPLTVAPGIPPTNLGDIVLSNTGTLSFTVTDSVSGTLIPAKITIVAADEGTDNPDFGSQYLSLRSYAGLSKNSGLDGLDRVTESNSSQLSEVFLGSPALNFELTADGTGTLELAPGSYVAFASRGLEYDIDGKTFSIAAGGATSLDFSIERVVDTSGWISMDFHVHSGKSFDSSVPITARVETFMAEGVEVIVSTDHDYITDYAPVIADLGAGSDIASVIGNELTGGIPVPADPTQDGTAFPEGIGHWNGWPLETVSGNRRNGAPQDEFITPGTAIDRLRAMDELALLGATPDTASAAQWATALNIPGDDEVIMLNHPRAGFAGTVVIGLFNGLANPGGNPMVGGYDPTKDIDQYPNNLLQTPSLYNALVGASTTTALSFDAMELMNGGGVGAFPAVREDWCSLLDQGIHFTGTAVSDSHRPILENAGFARSFVASSTDDPGAVDEDELTQNVKAMQLLGTTGPFVRFSVEDDGGADVGLGGTAVATAEKVVLKVRVEAAPWIPVEEVRIYRNCELFETIPVQSSKVLGKVLRFNRALPRAGIDADSYLHVEAGVRLDANGEPVSPGLLQTLQTIEPSVVPFAFTNPVFVDRDGDGYAPPGL